MCIKYEKIILVVLVATGCLNCSHINETESESEEQAQLLFAQEAFARDQIEKEAVADVPERVYCTLFDAIEKDDFNSINEIFQRYEFNVTREITCLGAGNCLRNPVDSWLFAIRAKNLMQQAYRQLLFFKQSESGLPEDTVRIGRLNTCLLFLNMCMDTNPIATITHFLAQFQGMAVRFDQDLIWQDSFFRGYTSIPELNYLFFELMAKDVRPLGSRTSYFQNFIQKIREIRTFQEAELSARCGARGTVAKCNPAECVVREWIKNIVVNAGNCMGLQFSRLPSPKSEEGFVVQQYIQFLKKLEDPVYVKYLHLYEAFNAGDKDLSIEAPRLMQIETFRQFCQEVNQWRRLPGLFPRKLQKAIDLCDLIDSFEHFEGVAGLQREQKKDGDSPEKQSLESELQIKKPDVNLRVCPEKG